MFQTDFACNARSGHEESQSPQVGAMFQTVMLHRKYTNLGTRLNPLKSGRCFRLLPKYTAEIRRGQSQSPQVGAMFQTFRRQHIPG